MKRLFVGIALTDEVRESVTVVQDKVREVATRQGVRFVRPDKLHLTLLFLGEREVETIVEKCQELCARHGAFRLATTGLGGFPDLRRPKVLWLGLDGDLAPLEALQKDIEESLGETEDNYVPHITLARIVPGSKAVGYAAQTLAPAIAELPPAELAVEEVSLFESTPDGNYEILAHWPLTQPTTPL